MSRAGISSRLFADGDPVQQKEAIMRHLRSHILAVTVSLAAAPLAFAQSPDPSGHWEATMQLPRGDVRVELDLDRNGKGELAGTIGTPAQHLMGLPLARVVVEGRTITFFAREDQPFTGELSADGQSIDGKYRLEGQSIPLTLTRIGPARMKPAARIAAIPSQLEGTWSATVSAGSRDVHLVLTMANHEDGSSTGSLVNLDEGRLTVPVTAIDQRESGVTIEFKAIAGSFTGQAIADGSELAGTFTQGSFSMPITFRHATR